MEGLIVDTDTFVIVGAWNREILSQEWVMQNLPANGRQHLVRPAIQSPKQGRRRTGRCIPEYAGNGQYAV